MRLPQPGPWRERASRRSRLGPCYWTQDDTGSDGTGGMGGMRSCAWCNRAIMSVGQISSACPTTTTTGLASRSSRTSYATASTSSSRCCNRSRYPFPHRQVSCISREVRGIQPLAKARITSNRSTLPVEASRFLRTRWPSLRIKVSRIKTLR